MGVGGVSDARPGSPMWTPAARAELARESLHYATSLTDAEWAVVAPLLPGPAATGRPRRWPRGVARPGGRGDAFGAGGRPLLATDGLRVAAPAARVPAVVQRASLV